MSAPAACGAVAGSAFAALGRAACGRACQAGSRGGWRSLRPRAGSREDRKSRMSDIPARKNGDGVISVDSVESCGAKGKESDVLDQPGRVLENTGGRPGRPQGVRVFPSSRGAARSGRSGRSGRPMSSHRHAGLHGVDGVDEVDGRCLPTVTRGCTAWLRRRAGKSPHKSASLFGPTGLSQEVARKFIAACSGPLLPRGLDAEERLPARMAGRSTSWAPPQSAVPRRRRSAGGHIAPGN